MFNIIAQVAQTDVQERIPVRFPVYPVQHRQQAPADLGQEYPERPHQAPHRPGHPVLGPRDHGHQRHHRLHHLPRQRVVNTRNQAALSGHDHQESQEIFHLRGAGARRQECQATISRLQLPVHHAGQALHLYHAHAPGRGLEPDPIQPVRLHPQGLRLQLHRDPPSYHPRQLPNPQDLLLRPALQRGGAPPRIQTFFAHPEAAVIPLYTFVALLALTPIPPIYCRIRPRPAHSNHSSHRCLQQLKGRTDCMDFEKLAEIIPKASHTWTIADTQKWIEFAGLQSLAQQFQILGIDGSCLHALNEKDLKEELGITSNIKVKKIMKWVQEGFGLFDAYLKQNNLLTSTIRFTSPSKASRNKQSSISKIEELPFEKEIKRESTYSGSRNKNEENELVIKQCEVPQANFYSFKNKGGLIGRNGNNEISIPDQFVSRFHAEIFFEDSDFFIKDCGSSSGTFFRIVQKKQVENGNVLEMGSNQFEVNMSDKNLMALKIIEGSNIGNCFIIPKKDKITIGRKPHNEISFPDDQHLSNIHATFFHIDGTWYVEDLGSTNGTWVRLSPEAVPSAKWKLEDKTQFKISTNFIYECRRNVDNRKTEKEKQSEKCVCCNEADRSAIILPCKHNTHCFECIEKLALRTCDTCGAKITDTIRIFKA